MGKNLFLTQTPPNKQDLGTCMWAQASAMPEHPGVRVGCPPRTPAQREPRDLGRGCKELHLIIAASFK